MKDNVNRWVLLWWTPKTVWKKLSEDHFVFEDCMPKMFPTRKKAREYAQKRYGYIKGRRDLRSEPHYWRLPKAIQAKITIEENPNEPF